METTKCETLPPSVQNALRNPASLDSLIDCVVRQTGAQDRDRAIDLVTSGEFVIAPRATCWREQDGVISFDEPFVAPGLSGAEWSKRLMDKGYIVAKLTRGVLVARGFKPLVAGSKTKIVVLKGSLFANNFRTSARIRDKAEELGLRKPPAEIACLFRENVTDVQIFAMGLRGVVVMHDSFADGYGTYRLLGAGLLGNGRRLTWNFEPDKYRDKKWRRGLGFVFSAE